MDNVSSKPTDHLASLARHLAKRLTWISFSLLTTLRVGNPAVPLLQMIQLLKVKEDRHVGGHPDTKEMVGLGFESRPSGYRALWSLSIVA